MYAMLCPKLGISFVVRMVHRIESTLVFAPWQAVNMIFRYIHRTSDFMLYFLGIDLRQ